MRFDQNKLLHLVLVAILIVVLLSQLIIISSSHEQVPFIEISSSYEIVPAQSEVIVSKEFFFKNTDISTNYRRGYYNYIYTAIPSNVEQLNVYNGASTLNFYEAETEPGYYKIEFDERVWYSDTYSFNIEYKKPVDEIVSDDLFLFYLYERGNNVDVTILYPEEYYLYFPSDDILVEYRDYDKDSASMSAIGIDEWNHNYLIEVYSSDLKRTETIEKVYPNNEDISIIVHYYEGEDEWAQHMIEYANTSLHLMEELTGTPYPNNYDIDIYQSIRYETWGYGGLNKGSAGIYLLHSENEITLIHEIAHYWTRNEMYEHAWLDEGYAELYTYLVLKNIDQVKAEKKKINMFNTYYENKDIYSIDLDKWEVPENLDKDNFRETHYVYNKAFVTLYKKYGYKN